MENIESEKINIYNRASNQKRFGKCVSLSNGKVGIAFYGYKYPDGNNI